MLAALYGGGWLSIAPNRLLPGAPAGAPALLGGAAHLLAAMAVLAAVPAGRAWSRTVAPALGAAAILMALDRTGLAAAAALDGRAPSARAMPGAGFWSALAGFAALALLGLGDARGRRGPGAAIGFALLAGAVALALAGRLDALSPVVEARVRADRLGAALGEHLALAGGALALALLLAVPLAAASAWRRRIADAAGALLSLVQIVPAIALFAALIPALGLLLAAVPALRALGIGALGATPTLVAVALYAALPLHRALLAGLTRRDPAVEAARALGMGPGRVALEVRLPLGFPLFFGGLRLAAVQAVGLVTLGGLVGSGGLGALVFEGMAQFAPDLILVAALPVVGLALAANGILRALERMAGAVTGRDGP